MTEVQSTAAYSDQDLRVLKNRAERAASAIRQIVISSPPWVCFAYFSTSQVHSNLGSVSLSRGFVLIVSVVVATLIARVVLHSYHANIGAADPAQTATWLDRLLALNIFLSTVWGMAPWLLWDPGHHLNHVFVELILLAVVTRFLVNRANHLYFFIGSFFPLAAMLFVRCLVGFDPIDSMLALMVPLYAFQVAFESIHIRERLNREARLRFMNEDISRELEEARDVALRKRVEAETANSSKTAFLANMSHELRTPLNAILGFSEIIAQECLGPVGSPRYKEYAGDIHSSGAHLLSLINDLLDVAKIEAGRLEIEPQMIEAKNAIDHAMKFVAGKAREREQKLSLTMDGEAALVYADERALKQIAINLVANAVKFTQAGGQVHVSTRLNGAGDFELMVADNGPGIPPEKMDRIFKPFSRVDNRYDSEASGTGLGLALVRGLTELHGGKAWIESEPGRGTRAFVVLPTRASHETIKRRA